MSVEKIGLWVALFCHCEVLTSVFAEIFWPYREKGERSMKSWGSWVFLSVAIGLGVGLTLVGSGGSTSATQDILKGESSKNPSDNQFKNYENLKAEDFWSQTTLSASDLYEFVNDKACFSNKKTYLACVNSILKALRSSPYHLTTDLKIKANESALDIIENSTERQNLLKFQDTFEVNALSGISFISIWEQILEATVLEKKKNLIAQGINGFLSVNRDPHTYISPKDYFKKVSSANFKSPYMIGIGFGKSNGKTIVRKVEKNSDADKAGLKLGDVVVSLNGLNTEMMTLNDISQVLRDKEQKVFNLVIQRNSGENKSENLIKKIVRTYRSQTQVSASLVGSNKQIGMVTLSKFARGVCEDVAGKIEWLKLNQIKGLVLDLQDNPGGLLSEAACIMGLFIGENKKAFSVKYFNDSYFEPSYTTAEKIYDGPMAVVINQNSASASELLAGALQNYKRAHVVGERTFGKGTFQELETWKASSDILFFETKGFYLLPNNKSVQLTGVKPDIYVTTSVEKFSEASIYYNPIAYDKALVADDEPSVASHEDESAITGTVQ